MTSTDAIRWAWTFAAGFGVLFAIWNLRESLIDNWTISQVRTRPVDLLRMTTRSGVYDSALILAALAADLLAGIFALAAFPTGALISLIASAGCLIVLSFTQTQRRRQIFRAIQLRPPKEG